MSQFTITIQLRDEDRALMKNLTDAIASMGSALTEETATAKEETVASKPRTTKPTASKPAAEKPASTKKPEPEPEPETSDDDDFDAPASDITREQVLAKLKEVSSVHGKPEAVGILRKVGGVQGLSDLPDSKFQAVFDALAAKLED